MRITVTSREKAMELATTILGWNEVWKDEKRSERAGYPILVGGFDNKWVSDLNDRLEVNDGNETLNIWIDPLRNLQVYQIKDALDVLGDVLYEIDDKFPTILENNTKCREARNMLYGCYREIKDIIDARFPEDENCKKWAKDFNLDEA